MLKRIFLICFFITAWFVSFVNIARADDAARIDSLKKIIPTLKDTAYINALTQLSNLSISIAPDEARSLALQALQKSKALHYSLGEASALYQFGLCAIHESNYDSALVFFSQTMELLKHADSKLLRCKIISSIGQAYYFQGNYDKAIVNFFQSLKLAQQLNNYFLIAKNYNSLGNSHYFQQNNAIALEYYSQATRYWLLQKNELKAAGTIDNIGLIYSKLGRYSEALSNHNRALEIERKYNNLSEVASTLSNIATTYHQMEKKKESLDYALQSHAIRVKLNEPRKLAYSYFSLGSAYSELNDDKKAVEYTLKGIELSKQLGLYQYVTEGYNNLALMYEQLGDYKNAYLYETKYFDGYDSLFTIEKSKQINELQANYDLEKKQRSIELLQKDATIKNLQLGRNKNWLISLSLILLGILIITVLLYNRFRLKKKANLLLAQQNDQINFQKKEITDSINYALLIQQSILAEEEDIKKIFPHHFILFKPKDIVSGDFYWANESHGAKLIGAVDCTGHGVPGAMMSLIGNNLLNQAVGDKGIGEPNKILEYLDEGVTHTLHQNKDKNVRNGMDLALCSIHYETSKINYSGAVNPIYIFSKQELKEIKGDKLYIGSSNSNEKKQFTRHEIPFQPGDVLYLFSDGIIDQFGKSGKKLMSKGFKKVLQDIQGIEIEKQKEALEKFLSDWMGAEEQTDDILVIGIQL